MNNHHLRLIERIIPDKNLGIARIGLVKEVDNNQLYYRGRHFEKYDNQSLSTNYRCLETEEFYLISECDPSGKDAHLKRGAAIIIDEDARQQYWQDIRQEPGKAQQMLTTA